MSTKKVYRFGDMNDLLESINNKTSVKISDNEDSEATNEITKKSPGKKNRNKKNKQKKEQKEIISTKCLNLDSVHIKHLTDSIKRILESENLDEINVLPAPGLPVWANSEMCLIPRGFQNFQNSCFMNACMQVLLHTAPMTALLEQIQHNFKKCAEIKALENGHSSSKEAKLTKEMLTIFSAFSLQTISEAYNALPTAVDKSQETIHFNLDSSILPSRAFFSLLELDTGHQEDVAELLTRLLSNLHDEMADILGTKKSGSTDVISSGHQTKSNLSSISQDGDIDSWMVVERGGKSNAVARQTQLGGESPVARLFCGAMVTHSTFLRGSDSVRQTVHPKQNISAVKATKARQEAAVATKEPFFILPLEIQSDQARCIESCLRLVSLAEQVADYRDSETGASVGVNRRTSICRLPPCLLLQLKRFTFSFTNTPSAGGSGSEAVADAPIASVVKNQKLIRVQDRIVIPQECLSREHRFTTAQRTYRLRAVIFHVGVDATRGHYTCAVRWPPSERSGSLGNCLLYLDDRFGCLVRPGRGLTRLLQSHAPLNASSGQFLSQQGGSATTTTGSDDVEVGGGGGAILMGQPSDITTQPRTPYLLLYEHAPLLQQKLLTGQVESDPAGRVTLAGKGGGNGAGSGRGRGGRGSGNAGRGAGKGSRG